MQQAWAEKHSDRKTHQRQRIKQTCSRPAEFEEIFQRFDQDTEPMNGTKRQRQQTRCQYEAQRSICGRNQTSYRSQRHTWLLVQWLTLDSGIE